MTTLPPSGENFATHIVVAERKPYASTFTKVIAVLVVVFTGFYMLPWGIAAIRDVPHWGVFWVDLLTGWTIIGWIVALVMSLRSRDRFVVVSTPR